MSLMLFPALLPNTLSASWSLDWEPSLCKVQAVPLNSDDLSCSFTSFSGHRYFVGDLNAGVPACQTPTNQLPWANPHADHSRSKHNRYRKPETAVQIPYNNCYLLKLAVLFPNFWQLFLQKLTPGTTLHFWTSSCSSMCRENKWLEY